MASNDKKGLNRRAALSTLGVVAAGAAIASTAEAAPPASAATPRATSAGLSVGPYRVVSESTGHGAVTLELRSGEGDAFSVIVCARGGAQAGVAETDRLALFVRNDGSGDAPTHELHGRVVMGLADALRAHEDHFVAQGLLTMAERLSAHGGAVGL